MIGLIAVIGLVFQYLLRTALNSITHKEQLEGRSRELASLQVGLLGTVLQTLSLRDKMTARHSAAVARYSREIARELGLSEREQDIVHTAALLHDIGKFIFPDSILFADKKLSPRISRSSAGTRSRALGSSPASTVTDRSRRSSSRITSASTATAIRAASSASRSRSRRGSSPWPTPTT